MFVKVVSAACTLIPIHLNAELEVRAGLPHASGDLIRMHARPIDIHHARPVRTHWAAYKEEWLVLTNFVPQSRAHVRFGEIPMPAVSILVGDVEAPPWSEPPCLCMPSDSGRTVDLGHVDTLCYKLYHVEVDLLLQLSDVLRG